MSQYIDGLGADWLAERIGNMSHSVQRVTPVTFNQENRYLSAAVTRRPGFIRYDLFPFIREPLDCFDPQSPVREVNIKKGVQTAYTTLLESVLFYYIGHITTSAVLYISADRELSKSRVENNILPMLVDSDMMDRIRSADVTNTRKTGQTEGNIQWDGGGFLIYNGAKNAAKMRQFSMPVLLKDELDAWPPFVGKDGDPDSLTDDRASTYWDVRKILRGSTPTEKPSLIDQAYMRGDQRVYRVCCRSCNAPQQLRMEWRGTPGGFKWDYDDDKKLVFESVRYACCECGHEHFEYDKEKLFAEEEGAHWHPTAVPVDPGVRSYHLPAFYSPFGFRPWYKSIANYLEAYDPETKRVLDPGKFQVFYNNVLGEAFEVKGGRIYFRSVSGHRRTEYRLGEIPNKYAMEHSGSPILLVTCFVDVHKENLAVGVLGWCRGQRVYLIDYWRFNREKTDPVCGDIQSPVWERLRSLLEEKIYVADDGKRYNIAFTLVDAGYCNDTVVTFCSGYMSGVIPSLGRDRPAKNQAIKEFAEFKTPAGTIGYRILVDHYKDRLAPVLRRQWTSEEGEQGPYHFNAPIDLSNEALDELTVERLAERRDARGVVSYYWHRPGNARNELWDILVGCSAAVEILAYSICIQQFQLDTVDWTQFWDYLEKDCIYFTQPESEETS